MQCIWCRKCCPDGSSCRDSILFVCGLALFSFTLKKAGFFASMSELQNCDCSCGKFVSYGPGNCYLLDPTQFGFQESDTPLIGEGKYVGIGASKGVRLIEGPDGQNAANITAFIDGVFLSTK